MVAVCLAFFGPSHAGVQDVETVEIYGACTGCYDFSWLWSLIGPPPAPGDAGPSASELIFGFDAAKKIAQGLVLPCPQTSEPRSVYIPRMVQYCRSTVKQAFPVITWFRTDLPVTACRLAAIEEKAAMVYEGVLECKKD